jgi:hypothetical protein
MAADFCSVAQRKWRRIEKSALWRSLGLVVGDMAALQDEFADGKQEQEDNNEVEFGAEESVDHEQFSLSLVCSCRHDLGGGCNSRAATELIARLDSVPPGHLITEFRSIAVLMSIAGRRALDRVLA